MAGLDAKELTSILRGEPPTQTPNPRFAAHKLSFFAHFRPRTFPADATGFRNTYFLGFFCVFLFVVELITGLILTVYYQPFPSQAYASVQQIVARVPFGALVRDIHRLAGEIMVVCVGLHMLRVFWAGAYKGRRRLTWVMGIGLFMATLAMAFTGYLRPWDQRAYWAVTIGTSILESIPVIGGELNLLIRGGPDIGAAGLLRFNLLHVFVLPLIGVIFLGVHYYRVARIHGISRPVRKSSPSPGGKTAGRQPIPFIPDMMIREAVLTIAGLLVLTVAACFFYDAPLEHHADPKLTPMNTQAPWFFLWLQGLLKLGDKALMGIWVPMGLILFMVFLPYLDPAPVRRPGQRPLAIVLAVLFISGLFGLSLMGTHHFGIDLPPAQRILQDLAPDEGEGPVRRIPFGQLKVGLYEMKKTDINNLDDLGPQLRSAVSRFFHGVGRWEQAGVLPGADGVFIVEDWQADLKRVTMRISWHQGSGAERKSADRMIHIHRDR